MAASCSRAGGAAAASVPQGWPRTARAPPQQHREGLGSGCKLLACRRHRRRVGPSGVAANCSRRQWVADVCSAVSIRPRFEGLMAPYVQKLITDMAEEEVSMLLGVSSEITKLEDNMEGSRIKELNQRLDEIRRGAAEFNFLANIRSSRNRRTIADAEHSSSLKSMSEFDETAIVGEKIERDTKELAQVLLSDENHHDLKVVSIVGMGGMGKTTLAQKIFNEPTDQKHFKVKVWLSITQQFDEAELLRTAIEHAGGVLGGAQDKTLPTRNLTDAMSVGRFLLVLDDMWSDKAWSDVFCVPARKASQKQLGSRILITTRLEHLAPMMGEYFHQHHVRPLDIEDAWSLLKKQLPPDQVVGIDRLKNIETEILKKCEGLPLAIKVIGGLLSTRYPSERDWNVVLTCPTWSVAGLPEQLDSRIYLSYEDLSPQLKQCFMYCSLFPKGEEILEDVVVPMWISEGFIQPPDESSSHEHGLEEMATEYYRELIRRNLIEPAVKYSLTGYRCTMHDVVRTFAEYMARKESVVVVDDRQAATCGCRDGSKLVRHLSVGQTISAVEWVILQKQKSLRTLIIRSSIKFQPGDTLRSFSSLQVLFIHAPASAADFKSLRFLQLESLPCCTQLPDGLCFLPCLQVLVVKDAPAIKRIGPEFQAPSCLSAGHTAAALAPAFPKLRDLQLVGLCEWEEWEWNDDGCEQQQGSAKATIAMPCLERLEIQNCKLSYLPLGLASVNRQALRRLHLYDLTNLTSVENFPSVVKLDVFRSPKLKRISGLSSLHMIRIVSCPNLEVLEGVPSLDSLALQDQTMEALPGYLRAVNPRYLRLHCSKKLYKSLSSPGSSEWNKIRHIEKHDISYNEN
ncbi:unnamed protein product [Urochloa decumbens]|uniref:NB-ARC domain-containing protein n=1 Tax=Urochloa decumbens TaxID=240449 RepID=A0ABC9AGX1_9POAL